ncbi:hypothetical protein OS493_003937 [Desmophyllum pertusum]|uniref:Uncharacterized protein n=1 Tax=Desmophyllum pertusum TaxID=174260 RepID=A0A9W9ZT24_9CNID|nr:hypothetical protein OS493_003937 [Desmophyllum pertusum]
MSTKCVKDLPTGGNGTQTEDKLLIPVAYISYSCQWITSDERWVSINDSQLLAADQTNVEIIIPVSGSDDLLQMGQYLERLYFWFLLGPIITLEWLRRTKKLCCMSGGQLDHVVNDEERATGDEETVVTVGETDLHSVQEETPEHYGPRSGRTTANYCYERSSH